MVEPRNNKNKNEYKTSFLGFLATLRNGEYGSCPWCEKYFANLKVHVEDVHVPSEVPCPLCGKIFQSKNKMFSHKYRSCPNKIVKAYRKMDYGEKHT